MQLLFVNGRLLRSTQLAGAWSAAYATFALAQRQPFGVLFLDVPADHVDPNVHPTKSDVRLAASGSGARRGAPRDRRDAHARCERAHARRAFVRAAGRLGARTRNLGAFAQVPFAWDGAARDGRGRRTTTAPARELAILAQLDDTFVLATDGSALVLVDQHAAHERVAFEAIADRARRGAGATEPLLDSVHDRTRRTRTRHVSSARATRCSKAGLDAEPFGERTYRICATPAGYGARAFDLPRLRRDLGGDEPGLSARERVWASLACHSVVRAGERLEPAEMQALLARLVRCENPMHCPHGRPTIVRIEADAIARMFKRS